MRALSVFSLSLSLSLSLLLSLDKREWWSRRRGLLSETRFYTLLALACSRHVSLQVKEGSKKERITNVPCSRLPPPFFSFTFFKKKKKREVEKRSRKRKKDVESFSDENAKMPVDNSNGRRSLALFLRQTSSFLFFSSFLAVVSQLCSPQWFLLFQFVFLFSSAQMGNWVVREWVVVATVDRKDAV